MKRFWKTAAAEGSAVLLDGRPLRTPKRSALKVPSSALAAAIAAEWNGVDEDFDPRALPLTGLANAAIDIVAADHDTFADGLARYGESDLLVYRAEAPAALVRRQAAEWDPLLAWARTRYDIHVEVVQGIMHRPQPEATAVRLRDATRARTGFELAGLSPIVTIAGSLVTGLALVERAFSPDRLWSAAHLEELWQEESWGIDDLAVQARASRRAEWDAAARFLTLLD